MSKRLPLVALVSYPHFSPFHFGVPFLIFSAQLPEQALFDLKIVTPGGTALAAERALFVQPDGGLELLAKADIVVIPGWHDLAARPEPELMAAYEVSRPVDLPREIGTAVSLAEFNDQVNDALG